MRIAIFSDQFYPELSGVVDSITALAKELARRGHYVHFYVPHYSARDYQKIGAHEKDSEFGKKISSRHLSFSNNDELNFFLRTEVPFYISCSTAFYKFPAARPMEAKQFVRIFLTSVEAISIFVYFPSWASTLADDPADLIIVPPLPGSSSTL